MPSKLHEWIVTVDHKRLGIMYIATSLFFFAVAGILAALMRTQLAFPNGTFVPPDSFQSASLRCTEPPWCSWSACHFSPAWPTTLCP